MSTTIAPGGVAAEQTWNGMELPVALSIEVLPTKTLRKQYYIENGKSGIGELQYTVPPLP